jgi:putative transposase
MQSGIKAPFKPDEFLAMTLRQWMGCSRFIWNAKISENEYFYSFGSKFVPITQWQGSKLNPNPEFAFVDKTYSQFKADELTPWLSDCPSQILRNSATRWYETQWKFMRGECGPPQRKYREDGDSVWLTKELFRFGRDPGTGLVVIEIGTEKNPIGVIRVKWRKDRKFAAPNSITLKVKARGKWTISFSFEDKKGSDIKFIELQKDWKKFAQSLTQEELETKIEALDMGIKIPVASTTKNYNFTKEESKSLYKQEQKRKKWQKQLARQLKGSCRREKTKRKISATYEVQTNIRVDRAHKITYELVAKTDKTIFITEDLKVKNMTASASGSIKEPGQKVSQKSGLNKAILNIGWNRISVFLAYKAQRAGKIVFKINPKFTSQECSRCGNTHSDNRPEQELFVCGQCSFTDNADHNAAVTIKNRAIKLLQDSGTELSERGVLRPGTDKERSSRKRPNVVAKRAIQPVKKDELCLQF